MASKKLDAISGNTSHQSPEDRIWVHQFDEPSAQKFADRVLKISEKDHQEPITVYVDSYGGHIDGLGTMLSVMDSVKNPFITVATGKAMSAGAILLSHGDIRCVGQHARIMVHEALGGTGGNVNDVKNDANELTRISDYFMNLLAINCGKNLKHLKTMWKDQREVYLDANQALKFGIADHIGIPLITKHTSFEMLFLGNEKGKK